MNRKNGTTSAISGITRVASMKYRGGSADEADLGHRIGRGNADQQVDGDHRERYHQAVPHRRQQIENNRYAPKG